MRAPWSWARVVEEVGRRGAYPAVIWLDGAEIVTWTSAELARQAQAVASGLVRAGLAPGDPVLLVGPSRPEWLVVRLAIGLAGCLAVALDDLSTVAEVRNLARECGARIAFASAAHAATLAGLDAPPTTYLIDGAATWRQLAEGPPATLPTLEPSAPAMLLYTSGTTGNPKSFILTYANIFANLEPLNLEALVSAQDRVLLPLPFHHVYPLLIGLMTPLMAGATIVLPAAVTGPELVRAMQVGQVTTMVGVPRLYTALVAALEARVRAQGRLMRGVFSLMLGLSHWADRRLGWPVGRVLFRSVRARLGPKLRVLGSGGAKLEAAHVRMLRALGFVIRTGYGLAETAAIFTGNLPGRERPGSEGRPLAGGQLRIAEPDAAATGEIQLKGPSVFSGYRNNPEANAAAFTSDGWFRTGDLGHVDADGYVYITGRLKEMIVLGGGKNVFPEEVEKVYGAASPAIRELAVIERNGALVAIVVPDLAAAGQVGGRVEDVVRVALTSAAQTLPSYERLAGFAIWREPLPRTRLGKYRRFQLPALYERAKAGETGQAEIVWSEADRALIERAPGRTLWPWLEARFPGQKLGPDTSPELDLGVDSLAWVTLALELAEQHQVHLGEADIARVGTLRDLLTVAEEACSRAPAPVAAQAEQERWLEPPSLALRPIFYIVHGLNKLIFRLYFRLRVIGREHLPATGAHLRTPNHVSDLDPLAIAAALPFRLLRKAWWAGDRARLFRSRFTRLMARALQVFPVDERAAGVTLAMSKAVLRRGGTLTWFPESWRSPDGSLQRFLPGVGVLLSEVPVPVVPTAIAGAFEAMPRDRHLPRPVRITVAFSAPVTAAELGPDIPRELHDRVAILQLENDLANVEGGISRAP